MKFTDYLYDLDGCGCDILYNYDDIQLQAQFNINPSFNYTYTVKVELWDLEADNFIADVTEHFAVGIYTSPYQNVAFANIVSKRIADEMCGVCTRLRVTIKGTYTAQNKAITVALFDSFTNCMKAANCCVLIPEDGIIIKPSDRFNVPDMYFEVDSDGDLFHIADNEQVLEGFDFSIDENGDLILEASGEILSNTDFEIENGDVVNNF